MKNTKFLLIAANKFSGGALYYCNSASQGEKMIPFAYSMATRFDSIPKARQVIKRMTIKYKGLSNWQAIKDLD